MRALGKFLLSVSALGLLCGIPCLPGDARADADNGAALIPLEEGKKIAFDRQKGNCLACHPIADGEAPGNIGPKLADMQARYPDKAKLRARIFDPRAANPETVMPPFGQHGVLSGAEIDKIVEFIYSL